MTKFVAFLESGVTVTSLHANGMFKKLDTPVVIDKTGAYGIRFDPETGRPSELLYLGEPRQPLDSRETLTT